MVVLIVMVSMFSCATPTLKRTDGAYVHEKTGITYQFAPAAYSAEASGEAIARLVRDVAGEESLYAIEGQPTEHYLVTASGRVLYAESVALPTLSDFSVSEARLYSYALNMATVEIVTDAAQLRTLQSLCAGEVSFDADQIDPQTSRNSYELRFLGTGTCLGLSYSVQYWQCAESVLIYEEIDSQAAAEALYPDIPFTFVEEEGVTYACYDFGRYLFYNPTDGRCWAAGAILSSMLSA